MYIIRLVVLIELKCAEKIVIPHEAQLLNYLQATYLEVGLLLNFGPKPEYKRKIHSHKSNGLLSALFDQ